METLELSNPACRVVITPEQGGRILSLVSGGSGESGGPGVEHVGPHHLQTWLKYGEVRDPNNGGLMLFWRGLHTERFEVVEGGPAGGRACELRAEADGLELRKRFTLDPAEPVLTLEVFVTNRGASPVNAQVECFFNWSFGPTSARRRVVSVMIQPGAADTVRRPLPPFGTMFIEAFDIAPSPTPGSVPASAVALCDLDAEETLLQLPDANWARFSFYQMIGASMRGPYSIEKVLRPGEALEARLRLAIVRGAAAIDALRGGAASGLLADREVGFTDEPLRVAASLANLDAAEPVETHARLAATGEAGAAAMPAFPAATLRVPAVPFRGASTVTEVGGPAAPLPEGTLTLREVFDARPHGVPPGEGVRVRVLDARRQAEAPLIQPAAAPRGPAFPVRAIHLILSQQDVRGLTLDAMKWLLENVVAPAGFTHVIWEFNKALRYESHPELAEPWSYRAAEVAGLARFGRSLGIEPIPQINLFGHQHESNLTTVYPELQETPGDTGVYCPSHPKTRQIVEELVREMMQVFDAKLFHMGHDEVQFRDCPQKVGVCPRCRGRHAAEVFADDVKAIDAAVKREGGRSILWGDHLIPPDLGGANVNGEKGEVYRAVDLLPRDLVVADWHYGADENHRSTDFFLAKGFEVWCAVWFIRAGIRVFSNHAKAAGAKGMISTHWCRPDLTSLPIEGLLYAAQAFQDPASLGDPDLDERILLNAHGLWRRWTKWEAR